MNAPNSEQKTALPSPMQISSSPSQTEAYCQMLVQKIGIQKVEIINNEVIAAGQALNNPQQVTLVHCRVTPQQLEFTVRSQSAEITQSVIQDINAAFAG